MKTNMRDLSKKLLFCVVLTLSVSACNAETSAKANKTDANGQTQAAVATEQTTTKVDNKKKDENHMILQGKVVYNDFEGGFYGFIADNGKKYTPMDLPLEHRKNGLVLQMQAEVMKDMMTTTQYGELIKVSDIKVIDDSNVKEVKASKY